MNMKKRILVISILILMLAFNACNIKEKGEDFTARSLVAELSSDKYEGRLTGTKGNDEAVKLVSSIFEKLNLEKYSNDYLHRYNHKFFKNIEQKMIIEFDDGSKKECEYGKDFLEKAPIKEFSINSYATSNENELKNDKKIFLAKDNSYNKELLSLAKLILLRKDGFGKNVVTRDGSTPIIQISDKIFNLLNNRNSKVYLSFKGIEESIEAHNIVGKLSGKNKDNAIVLSAHLDHVGKVGDVIYRGAIDNCSGTAVLLDLARKLKEYSNENQLESDIIFCAFNGEESGLQGSKAFAEEIKKKYKKIYNVNLDTLGTDSGNDMLILGNERTSNDFMQFFSQYMNKKGFKTRLDYDGYISDNYSFSNNEISSLNVAQNIPDFLHTPIDTSDKVNIAYLDKLTNALYDLIIENTKNIFEQKNSSKEIESSKNVKNITEQMREAENQLQFGEYKLFQVDDSKLIAINSTLASNTSKDFYKYYPNNKIPEVIGIYKFNNIYMHFNNEEQKYYNKISTLEMNKVYNVEEVYGFNKLEDMALKYYNGKNGEFLCFYLNSQYNSNHEKGNSTSKELKGKDMVYNIYLLNNKILRIETIININNEKFILEIRRGPEKEIDSQNEEGTKVKIKDIVHNWDNSSEEEIVAFLESLELEKLFKEITK